MEKEFFADKHWPYTLQSSGSFVHSPKESLGSDRFIDTRYYRHFSSAFAQMLTLSSAMFEQELLPYGPKNKLYNDVFIIHTETRKELASYMSFSMSEFVRTGEFAGLYLAFADPAAQMAAKYRLPLDRLSHYDPDSILQMVADYDTVNRNIIRVDPKMDLVTSDLFARLKAENKDTHQIATTYSGQHGGFQLEISHHFDGLAAGLDGLTHYPLFIKQPPAFQTLALTRDRTVLLGPDTEIAALGFAHFKGEGQQPPAGFHLSFSVAPADLQQAVGFDVSGLQKYQQAGKDYYLIALADGGKPLEVTAFTALRVGFHEKVIAARKAQKKQTGGPPKNIFPSSGKSFSR